MARTRLFPARACALLAAAVSLWCTRGGAAENDAPARAREILSATGITGGLIVHIGARDAAVTAALRAGDAYLVHGLYRDRSAVERARAYILARGLYGPVAADRLDGARLPYVDNTVNLAIVEDSPDVPAAEITRVLAPHGVAYVNRDGRWEKTVKPRPAEIDEWTHYLHDPGNNAVAHDTVVAPPRGLAWVGSPRWSRHHDHMSSISALVSAGGRIFYIFDEAPAASIQLPPRWALIARDAFNGVVLWKRPIPLWHPHLWPLKSGPAQLPRRLVAAGDRVYVTLGLDAPVTALDAATGETARTYEGTRTAEEILLADGVLFLLVNETPVTHADYKPVATVCWDEMRSVNQGRPWDAKPRRLVALKADSGETLWRHQHAVVPLTLAVDRERVYFHDGERVVSLRRDTGEELWRSAPLPTRSPLAISFAPTLVVQKDVVLFAGGRAVKNQKTMTALAAATGAALWTKPHHRAGHNSPEDMFVIDGVVWSGETAQGGPDTGIKGTFTGYDLATGEVRSEFKPDVPAYWFHQRCYRAKATDRFILTSRTGIEFIDVRAKHWDVNHWVRGGCVYGIMPCNGLVYAPMHPCVCYVESKMYGFTALRPCPAATDDDAAREPDRLERGPAYDAPIAAADSGGAAWPTYRHDAARSGATSAAVPGEIEPAWTADLGGTLTSLVAAEGKLFVASVERHTLHALDERTGTIAWSFTAGGRIDSPPTVWEGRAIFGCADGRVYCLRASDGVLCWRFRAAPADRRIIAFEGLESVWPVHGSVLVLDGVVHCVAGRSAFVDGGMRFLGIDARHGRLLSETRIDERDPETGAPLQDKVEVLNMPVALPDILSSDGRSIYMRSQRFDRSGVRPSIPKPLRPELQGADQLGEGRHLFCPTGFLDDTWWHRTYWLYGRNFSSGCNWWFRAGRFTPSGRLLVFDDAAVYGFGRVPELFVWSPVLEYHLFRADKGPSREAIARVLEAETAIEKRAQEGKNTPNPVRANALLFDRSVTRGLPRAGISAVAWRWSQPNPPFLARAMVLAGGTLFLAGPPDVVDEDDAFARRDATDVARKLDEQTAAWEGRRGALLWAVKADDGTKLAERALAAPPVWDGMIAANGRLYLATAGGAVLCFAGK